MKYCHTIDGSLPLYLGDSGGSNAPRPIGAASSGGLRSGEGGLGLALPGLGGGRLGSPDAPNPGGASTSI